MVDEMMVCVCEDGINVASAEEYWVDEERLVVVYRGHGEAVISSNVDDEEAEKGGCSLLSRECRICEEEDEEHRLEVPCACNGTLKFAHRECIQRWCNKKGDITCEICRQVYSPNYTLPPARNSRDVLTIDIRQGWGINLAFAAAEREFLESEYEEYALENCGSIACFRLVAIILMLILFIRQALVITRDFGMVQESSTFFNG